MARVYDETEFLGRLVAEYTEQINELRAALSRIVKIVEWVDVNPSNRLNGVSYVARKALNQKDR